MLENKNSYIVIGVFVLIFVLYISYNANNVKKHYIEINNQKVTELNSVTAELRKIQSNTGVILLQEKEKATSELMKAKVIFDKAKKDLEEKEALKKEVELKIISELGLN